MGSRERDLAEGRGEEARHTMRECCGGKRAASVPAILIPSERMGEYETLKERRLSAPLKRPPGLFPLPVAGTYGPTPDNSRQGSRQSGAIDYSSSNSYVRRSPKPKMYSSYSVSSDCSLHTSSLSDMQPKHRRASLARDYTPSPEPLREEAKEVSWEEGLRRPSWDASQRRPSISPQTSSTSLRPRTNSLSPERLRRATPSPSFPSRPSSRRSLSSESYSSSDTSPEGALLSYYNRQVVSPRPDIFRLLCNDLKEALKEEEEEEEEEEQVDSMGIIGLSNKLFRETRKNQENFLAVNSFMERDNTSQAV